MRGDDGSDDGKPEPGATCFSCARRVCSPKAFKDFLTNLRGDALTVIDDGKSRGVSRQRREPNLERRISWREAKRVAKEIRHDLTNLVFAGLNVQTMRHAITVVSDDSDGALWIDGTRIHRRVVRESHQIHVGDFEWA